MPFHAHDFLHSGGEVPISNTAMFAAVIGQVVLRDNSPDGSDLRLKFFDAVSGLVACRHNHVGPKPLHSAFQVPQSFHKITHFRTFPWMIA